MMIAFANRIGTTLRLRRDEFSLALRIAMLILGLSVGTVALIAFAQKAAAASLRGETIINGDYIRLGDVFDGVKNADYVLGPAPEPGKDMILNARTLYKIATALDVDWKPASPAEQVILRREASIIGQNELSGAVEEKIRESGVKDSFTLTFTTAPGDMLLPSDAAQTVEVSAFNFDPQTDNFRATLVAPSIDNPIKRTNVSGRIERLVSVPVLKNGLKKGDIIGSRDIDYLEIPRSRVTNDTVTEEKNILNMTPRRLLSAGRPVQMNELEHPQMVDRGDSITLVFATGPMFLTVKGKSLQAGAIGDSVRVSNVASNKMLQGVVTAHREVTIY